MVKYHHLTREQRYAITQLPKEGQSFRSIARTIEVSASTISREGLGVTRRIKFTLIIERKSGR
ncbi:helix-turn-helix domain-containing protein, partial [Porphyromonas loveana]